MIGTLYLCATPIGNLEDITLRVLRVLKEADLIAAEDTRRTAKLLHSFDIQTPMASYHEHNKRQKTPEFLDFLRRGKSIALVTDAGMPGISDPGADLANACIEASIPVTCCPGASAVLAAVCLSGLPAARFAFEGFLPRENKPRREALEALQTEPRTIVLYESPHHLLQTLLELYSTLGARPACVLRELTKLHEEATRGTIATCIEHYKIHAPLGECVIVVGGADKAELLRDEQLEWQDMTLEAHVNMYIDIGLTEKDAIKRAAKDRGMLKREAYNKIKTQN